MIWLTLVIGVLNLGVGYALAVRLGYGPPSLDSVWHPLSSTPLESVTPGDSIHPADRPPLPEPPASLPEDPTVAPEVSENVELSAGEMWTLVLGQDIPRLADLDAQLSQSEPPCDEQTVWTCLDELRQICRSHLSESNEAAVAGEDLETAILEQLAQAETTLNNLQLVDVQTDPSSTVKRLRSEISRMLKASKTLQDCLDEAIPADEQPAL